MTALLEELGLETANWQEDDKGIALGSVIPEGKYHARLVHAAERQAGGYTIDELKFEILHGPYKGKVIEDDLFHTGTDAQKTEKAKLKRRSYYHRLGLLTKSEVNGEKKYTLTPGKNHIRDCLDVQVIIDVVAQEESWEDKKTGANRKMMKNKLSYFGIYKLDDPKVKDVPRATGTPAPITSATKPAPDLSGI